MIKLAIISPNSNNYSETFIKAHVDLLDGKKFFLYGSYKPIYYSGNSIVLQLPLYKRIFLKYVLKTNLLDHSIKYFLRKNRIDIILAEYGPTGCAILDIAKELRIPLIVHFHGYDASSVKLIDKYREQYQLLFQYASKVIAVSLKMKSDLIKLGANEDKVIYSPCGPSLVFADIVPDYDHSGSVCFVGRFVDKKAPYILIEVMNRVLKKGVTFKLVMAGDGVLLDSCRNLARIYGLEKYITFPGAVDQSEVKNIMRNSFCYIQHSVTSADGETEGTPVSVTEASLAGLPVISTNHAGISDVILHNETGFLVDEFDVDSMTEYLLLLFGNRELAREMGIKAKKRVFDNFSLDKHISILNYEIEKAVNGS
jgi:colanic acid/amylovoran biosynthesis glycosyltransferase